MMDGGLERIWEESAVTYSKNHSRIHPKGLRKIMKNVKCPVASNIQAENRTDWTETESIELA
jgi:hypothetical protein